MNDRQQLLTMLAKCDADFVARDGDVIIPYGDTDTETVFVFDKEGNLLYTWSRRQNI